MDEIAKTKIKAIKSDEVEKLPSVNDGVEKVNREFQEKSTLKDAQGLGLPYVNIGKTPLNPDFLKLIKLADAKKARVIPFFRQAKNLRLAVENPNHPDLAPVLKRLEDEGFVVSLNLASKAGIDEALDVYQNSKQFQKPKIVKSVAQKSVETYEKEIAVLADVPKRLELVTAEEGLNLLNIGAMKTTASDVHYEPQENDVVVRFRIDGVLHRVFTIPKTVFSNIANQLKYAAKLQLNVANVPQDGRYVFPYNKQKVAVRVSTIPTPYGEAFVCRYLASDSGIVSLEDLGFQGEALTKVQKASEIAHGMILCTGPTGSGKSTTLYAILSKMKTPENKIITLEDPVEYYIEGITQSQISEKDGYNFAGGLKAVLRQDPDIVMLGEIRDLETAQTGAQAALTGHVLLSTLHTNSAIESIPRLVNMGLKTFMVAPALHTIIAQRLVRKLCPACAVKEAISESEKLEFEEVYENLKKVNSDARWEIPTEVPKATGCDACSNTGYKGRLVIAEVVTVSDAMKAMILNKAGAAELFDQARKEGMLTMSEDGHLKVAQGLTTLEEVHRATSV